MKKTLLYFIFSLVIFNYGHSQKIEITKKIYYNNKINRVNLKIILPKKDRQYKKYSFIKHFYDKNNVKVGGGKDIRFSHFLNKDKNVFEFAKTTRTIQTHPKIIYILKEKDYRTNKYTEVYRLDVIRVENDVDEDGVINENDNCPLNYNPNQGDTDNDQKGDACDSRDNRDSDGDGLENWEDQCPDEKGPASNNGCPLPVGKPDLKHYYTNDITGGFSSIYINNELVQKFKKYDNIQLQTQVKNIGETETMRSFSVTLYLSRSKTFDRYKSYEIASVTSNSLRPGSVKHINKNYYVPDYSPNSNLNIFTSSGLHYIHFVIDLENSIEESNENNNIATKKFYFDKNAQKDIIIKDLYGRVIAIKSIKNKQDEKKIKKSLKQGLYFVEDNYGTKYKFYKFN